MTSWTGSPTPRSATPRTERDTFGGALVDVARALGIDLMPWQRCVADVALEHVAGRLAYRQVGVSVPRQSGKTTMILALIAYRMLSSPGQRVAYGAQTRLAARGKLLDDWWPLLARSPLGDLFRVSRVNGSEAVRTAGGSMLSLLSADETAGHGATLDLAILDEAWSLDQRAEQSVRPAMATRPNAQLWLLSTAGTARSVYWRSKVDAGRLAADSGLTGGLCYFEWSAPPDADISDPATWRQFMPALGHTVDEATIAADLAAMDPAEWRRAYGNQFSDEADEGWRVIPRDVWAAARL